MSTPTATRVAATATRTSTPLAPTAAAAPSATPDDGLRSPPLPPEQFQRIARVSGTLAPGIEQELPVHLDAGGPILLLVYTAEPLRVALRDPNGRAIAPATPTGDPAISYTAYHGKIWGRGNAVWGYRYLLDAPIPGIWHYALRNEGAAPTDFLAWSATAGPIALRGMADRASYHPGETFTIEAALLDGATPLAGATVTGTIVLADESSTPLTFADDGVGGDTQAGDGILTARGIVGATSGNATITIEATLGDVVRQEDIYIAIGPQSARIARVIESMPVDADGDRLYDTLNFTVALDVGTTGHFEVLGSLYDAQGEYLATGTYSTYSDRSTPLSPGAHTVTLRINGIYLRTAGKDGPYRLDLTLTDQSGATVKVDAVTGAFLTEAYRSAQFTNR